MENDMKKIGFVIPWYYEDIRGGAEQEMRGQIGRASCRERV